MMTPPSRGYPRLLSLPPFTSDSKAYASYFLSTLCECFSHLHRYVPCHAASSLVWITGSVSHLSLSESRLNPPSYSLRKAELQSEVLKKVLRSQGCWQWREEAEELYVGSKRDKPGFWGGGGGEERRVRERLYVCKNSSLEFVTSPGWTKALLILHSGSWKQICHNYPVTKLYPYLILFTMQLLFCRNFSCFSACHCICRETESDNIKCR